MLMRFIKVDEYQKLSRKAANIISAQIIIKPDSVIGLATGSTPLGVYRQLIEWYDRDDLDFSQVTVFNLDEYYGLGAHDIQSYSHYMNDNFFKHINIDKSKTFIPNGLTDDISAECRQFDERIQKCGGIDLQLLGIGHDGHIGFNEPSDAFEKSTHIVNLHQSTIQANARFFGEGQKVPEQAITMGMISIMQAKKILLIAGREKAEIVNKAFFGPITPQIPASILQLHADITVILEENRIN